MNFTLEITASPELLGVLNTIANRLSPKEPLNIVQTFSGASAAKTPQVDPAGTAAPKQEKKAAPKEDKLKTAEPQNDTSEAAEEGSTVSLDDLKKLAIIKAKEKKSDAIKALLQETGVENINDLPEEHYAMFYRDLEAI